MLTPASKSTGSAILSGTEGFTENCRFNRTGPPICIKIYDRGTVTITVNGYAVSVSYGAGSTAASVASALVTQLNNGASPVSAAVSGSSTIQMTSLIGGVSANYAISTTYGSDFPVTLSGSTLTGGATGTPSGGGLNQQYAYDNWGNLTQMGGTSGFTQSSNNQNQVATFQYDSTGRLFNDGVRQYTYDSNGMMLTSSDGASYTYDGREQRSSVTSGGAESDYYYFGGRLYAIYNASGWTDLIYAGSQRIATVAGTQTAAPVYDVLDHIGSEVATVNGGTGAQSSLDYTPYGQVLNGTNSDGFIFTGLQRDPDGLDHADMRQYTSMSGRWITADPYSGSYDIENPQSLNRYAYVNNNPLGFVDPSGEAGAGILTGIGGNLCLGAGPLDNGGNFNFCSPLVSALALQFFGKSATLYIPYISAAISIGCGFVPSSDGTSTFCGQSGWTAAVFKGKDKWIGTAVNDGVAIAGLATSLAVPGAEAAAGFSSAFPYLMSCFTSPADPVCDAAIILFAYTALNDIFSIVWDFLHPDNFKGSLLPRPNARGGLSSYAVGIPNRDKQMASSLSALSSSAKGRVQ